MFNHNNKLIKKTDVKWAAEEWHPMLHEDRQWRRRDDIRRQTVSNQSCSDSNSDIVVECSAPMSSYIWVIFVFCYILFKLIFGLNITGCFLDTVSVLTDGIKMNLKLAATLRWFTAGGAIRIALRQLSQTWKLCHYDIIDDVITRKL